MEWQTGSSGGTTEKSGEQRRVASIARQAEFAASTRRRAPAARPLQSPLRESSMQEQDEHARCC